MKYEERKKVIEACKFVKGVVRNAGGKDSKPSILKVKPSVIVHGDDWTGESYAKQLGVTAAFLKKNKVRIQYVPYTKSISTTNIIKRIK